MEQERSVNFIVSPVTKPRSLDEGTINLMLNNRALTCYGGLISENCLYRAMRVNYRIFLNGSDSAFCFQSDKPLIDGDTFILDWGFTPDSTKLVFADEISRTFYVYETASRRLLYTVRPSTFSQHSGMVFETQMDTVCWSHYDVRYLVYLSNSYAILISSPGHFILLDLSTGATSYYQSDHINHALDITLSDDMKLQFTKVGEPEAMYTAYLI